MDKVKKSDVTKYNEKKMRNVMLKLEDIKKDNIKLKDKLLNPNKKKEEKPSPRKPSKSPTKAKKNPPIRKESKPTPPKLNPEIAQINQELLVNTKRRDTNVGGGVQDFKKAKRATINIIKDQNGEAMNNKENQIKARYMNRIENIKESINKYENQLYELKDRKFKRDMEKNTSIFDVIEGKVPKRNEMFFKKIYSMYIDLREDYDTYYSQRNKFHNLSSDFQALNVS